VDFERKIVGVLDTRTGNKLKKHQKPFQRTLQAESQIFLAEKI